MDATQSWRGERKFTITKLLTREEIDTNSTSELLDWLDKVRIGVWLGLRYINRNFFNTLPVFHIDKRMGDADRMLTIYGDNSVNEMGLSLFGIDTPIFHHMPSCFGLRINNTILVNASCPWMISERAGFPHPSYNGEYEWIGKALKTPLENGRCKIRAPIFPKTSPPPGGISVFQPMFRNISESLRDAYDYPHIRRHSLNFDRGIGWPILDTPSVGKLHALRVRDNLIDFRAVLKYVFRIQTKLWNRWAGLGYAGNDEARGFVLKIAHLQKSYERMSDE